MLAEGAPLRYGKEGLGFFLTYSGVTSLVNRGRTKELQADDVPALQPGDRAMPVSQVFQDSLQQAQVGTRPAAPQSQHITSTTLQGSLWRALVKTECRRVLAACAAEAVSVAAVFVAPLLLQQLVAAAGRAATRSGYFVSGQHSAAQSA